MQAPGPAGDGRTHVGTLLVSNSLFSEVNCWFCTCNCRMVAINLRGSREHASRCRSSPVLPPSMLSPQPQGQSKGSGVLRPHSSCASEGERESKTVGSPPFPFLARHYVECAECKPQPDPLSPPTFYPPAPESHRLWLVRLAVLAVVGSCMPYPRCTALFGVRGKPRSSTNPGAAIVALGAKAFQCADDFLGESIGLRGTTIDWCMAFGATQMGGRGHVPSQALCARCVPTVCANRNLKDAVADGTQKRRVRLMQQLRLLRSATAHEDLRHSIDHFPARRAFARGDVPKVVNFGEGGKRFVRPSPLHCTIVQVVQGQ